MTQLDFLNHDTTASDMTPEDAHEAFSAETQPEGDATSIDSSTDGEEVSEDPTGPVPRAEPASNTTMDDTGQVVSPLHLFSTVDELLAPTDWGDALRLANFQRDHIRLTTDRDGRSRLLLHNRATGMWRMEGDPDFQPLFDMMLSKANEEALQFAKNDPTAENNFRKRLRRHIGSSSGGSVSKALKRCTRLADDPCVSINRVDRGSLNPVERRPVILCQDALVSLNDGMVTDPADLKARFLLDMTPAPTAFVPDATDSEAPGAVMMRRFLTYLGNGDATMLSRRLGWQLCGHHQTIDVIAGDCDALALLGRVLQNALGPSGARTLSMGRGAVSARHIADAMEQARICLWMGADTAKALPVWDLHGLITDRDIQLQGNVLLLVADWPTDWETLDHRIAGKCGWAWRVQERLGGQGIDPEIMLDQDGRQYLLAKLVEGAIHGYRQFQDTKEETGIGDPGQVAADEYSRTCAEEMRTTGATHEHGILSRALRFTNNARDVMTLADIDDAITAIGEEPIQHPVVGKILRRMWPDVESGRDRINGVQARVIRRISRRSHDPAPPESLA